MAGRPPPPPDRRTVGASLWPPLARYIDEFVTFLSSEVNPQELTAAPKFFEVLSRCLPKKALLVKLAVAIDHYDRASAEKRIRPQPDLCAFYTHAELEKQKAREASILELQAARPRSPARPDRSASG